MISLRMPDTAAGILKNSNRVAKSATDANDLHLLESKTRPNLGKYAYQASLYEKQEKAVMASML